MPFFENQFAIDGHSDQQKHLVRYHNELVSENSIIIHDAPAGAGKTYASCKIVNQLVQSGERVLFVQPTKELIGKTIKELKDLKESVRIHRLDGDVCQNVIARISNHLRETDADGQVLFITQDAFMQLPYVHRPDHWNLIADEIPQVHKTFNLRYKKIHSLLTSILTTIPIDDVWSQLAIGDYKGLVELETDMKSDNGIAKFKEALSLIKSSHWSTYVNTNEYSQYVASESKKETAPVLYAEMNPSIMSGYKSVRVAGAELKESLLYKLWNTKNIVFKDERLSDLKYYYHENGDRVNIYYATNTNWSKGKRNKHKDDIWIPLLKKVSDLSANKQFLYLGNNDTGDLFPHSDNATRLPGMPHGLNDYTNVDMVAFLAAYNPSPQQAAFLKFRGLTDEDIIRDMYYVKAYQAILRGGIRNPKKAKPQIVVVPDRGLAEWLQSVLKGSKIEWLGLGPPDDSLKKAGRPQIHGSSAERNRAYRKRESTKDHLANWQALMEKIPKHREDGRTICGEYCDEIPYILRYNVPQFRACIWDFIWSTHSSKYVFASSHDMFIAKLREYHQRIVPSKGANQVMTMGCPAPNPTNMRGEPNIICANGIILDNDEGDLTPEKFAELFPHTEMAIFNTYSCTSLHRRWRAYIPTEFIMTPPMYKNVVEQILKAVEKEGYNQKGTEGKRKDGFDRSKKSCADLMYLPCQAGERAASFFLEFRGPERKPLDPTQWINFDEEPEIVREFVFSSSSGTARDVHSVRLQEEIDFEIERWRAGNVPKRRNEAYSTLYYALKRNSIPSHQIEEIMTGEALLCSTKRLRDERLGQLRRLITLSNR